MTGPKKIRQGAQPGHAGQDLARGIVELSETQLADTAGGINFTSQA
jgi:hypothetical protein